MGIFYDIPLFIWIAMKILAGSRMKKEKQKD